MCVSWRIQMLGLLLGATLGACDGGQTQCTRDPDCPQGQGCAAGRCVPVLKTDTGVSDHAAPRDGLREVALPDHAIDQRRTDGGLTCKGNNDDKIERSEMPIAVGGKITYMRGSGITVNLKGTVVGGRTVWDLSGAAADDAKFIGELLATPSWASSVFPSATYVSLLDQQYESYGVFKATQTALQILGIISLTPDDTKITYDKPADMLRFPIVVGDSFESTAYSNGHLGSLVISNDETYTGDVLAAGDLKVPQLTLPVLLVRVKLYQCPAYPVCNPFNPFNTTRWTFLFVSECYGIVGRVVTESDPSKDMSAVVAKERLRISM
jgi:hypothetical protein